MSSTSLSCLILQNLITDSLYTKAVIPFLKEEYFEIPSERAFFSIVSSYYAQYNSLPDPATIRVELEENKTLSEQIYEETLKLVDTIEGLPVSKKDHNWIINKTEEFCKEQSLFNAIKESLSIIEGNGKQTKHAIPDLITQALAVSFDQNIGHFYFENAADRYAHYHNPDAKVRTHLSILNRVLDGGASLKTLNMILSQTNAGKSAFMCDMAANNLRMGANVLYISLEMAEESISERVDANLFDLSIGDIRDLSEKSFRNKIEKIKGNTVGNLVVKQFPPGSANVTHFEHLISELKIKKNFVPDIIYVDYMNLMASSRVRRGQVNSADYFKFISEELRALAIKHNVPVWTANQFNRSGFNNSDADLNEMADSFAVAMGADFIMALIRTEELDERGQVLLKQLKSRYSNMSFYKQFVVGVDPNKFRYFDLEDEAQDGIADVEEDDNIMDNTTFGLRSQAQKSKKSKGKFTLTV